MSKLFKIDKQTLEDLNLLGKYKSGSIFSFFNKTQTNGGEKLLQHMFQTPLTDAEGIIARTKIFRYFSQQNFVFPIEKEDFRVVEEYLGSRNEQAYIVTMMNVLMKKAQNLFLRDEEYQTLEKGMRLTIKMLTDLQDFLKFLSEPIPKGLEPVKMKLFDFFNDTRISNVLKPDSDVAGSFIRAAELDYLLRGQLWEQLQVVLEIVHQIDVNISVGQVAAHHKLAYAEVLDNAANIIDITDLRHPAVQDGVGNSVSFESGQNMIFLTGANMAGKSTFMKAFGIAIYLAHIGFPVAAKHMSFSIRDGLYSSINVSDNLNMGYSHFYAEVLRVKKAAEEVATGNNLVLLFDELFKGTNVKDAYDATYAVTAAFSEYRQSFFIISTHIIEVGEALQKDYRNVQFYFLPTIMEGDKLRYTYTMEKGITTDRQGMIIIENEGILDLLK